MEDSLYIAHRCSYGFKEREQRKGSIAAICQNIAALDRLQADLYRRGHWRKAEEVAWEIVELENKLETLGG